MNSSYACIFGILVEFKLTVAISNSPFIVFFLNMYTMNKISRSYEHSQYCYSKAQRIDDFIYMNNVVIKNYLTASQKQNKF